MSLVFHLVMSQCTIFVGFVSSSNVPVRQILIVACVSPSNVPVHQICRFSFDQFNLFLG